MGKRKYLGEVSLLGLNEFGQNPGLKAGYGALIGGGVALATSLATAQTTHADKRVKYALLAGLAASGGMYAMKSTRHAAIWGALGALAGAGIAWFTKPKAAGTGIPSVNYLNGLGIPEVNYLNGLGIPEIMPVPQSVGTIPGVHGPAFAGSRLGESNPVNLLGAKTPQSEKIALMGGPAVHGLSASYGATLLGGGR
jgi:hypothetical protein